MPSQTFDTVDIFTFDVSGKCDFQFQIWGNGGRGAAPEVDDCGGGGGGGYAEGEIPNTDLNAVTNIEITIQDPGDGEDSIVSLLASSGGFGVSGGGGGDGGDTGGGAGGVFGQGELDWITASFTGGSGGAHPSGDGSSAGSGGGSSAGPGANGVIGGEGATSPGAGGIAPLGGGNGGSGGALNELGENGAQPGGGGGGGGDAGEPADQRAIGGIGKVILTWTTAVACEITSNGGGATAEIDVVSGVTPVTTVQASGTPAPGYAIVGGSDAPLFSIDENTGALTFNDPPDFSTPLDADADNVYEVEVGAFNGVGGELAFREFSDIQAISITVLSGSDRSAAQAAGARRRCRF